MLELNSEKTTADFTYFVPKGEKMEPGQEPPAGTIFIYEYPKSGHKVRGEVF